MSLFIHFIVTFLFAIGALEILSTIIAYIFRINNFNFKIALLYNSIAILAVLASFQITTLYLPKLYSESKINPGFIVLTSKNWNEPVSLTVKGDNVIYSLCGQKFKIKNRIDIFYNSLSSNLSICHNQGDLVNIVIKENPFLSLEITNSIIRKFFN